MANSTDFNGTTHANPKMRSNGTHAKTSHSRTTHASTPAPAATEKAGKTAKKARPGAGRSSKASRAARGVRLERHFTTAGSDPLETVVYERRSSTITNPDGSIVFKMEGAEVPASWSQLATDILISKYFRKAGAARRQGRGGDERSPGGASSVAHHPPRGRRLRRLLRGQERRRCVRGRAVALARSPVRRLQLAGLVQPRSLARVRDHRLGGQLGVGRWRGRRGRDQERLRAPAVLGVLHPGGEGRPHVHLRPGEGRGAPLQVRVGHGLELQLHSAAGRRSSLPAAAGRPRG